MEGHRSSSLRPPPGAKLVNVADLPFRNFEPPTELLKSPGYNLGGKLLKLLKLKKKKPSSTTTTHFIAMKEEVEPSMQTFHFEDLITHSTQFPTPMIEDVKKRYNDDSEEHSDNPNNCCSSASIASSSRNSSSSVQSFDSSSSNRSSGTPQSPFVSSCQLSNTQMMASILMSIMDAADSTTTTTTTSEELASSENENSNGTGPHESAWHEPRDEVSVESPIARRRHSSSSSTKKHCSGRLTPFFCRWRFDESSTFSPVR